MESGSVIAQAVSPCYQDEMAVPNWLVYNAQYQTIICHRCSIGITNPGLACHLKDHHPILMARHRQQITAILHRYPLILTDHWTLPPGPIEPIANVAWYQDGWKCDFPKCTYICRSRTPMHKHCQKQHQWKNPHCSGGSLKQRREAIYPWRQHVHCQRLFATGSGQRYFEIIAPPTAPSLPQASPDPPERLRRQLHQQLHTANAQHSSDVTITPGAVTEANPWLRRTRWDQHLQGQPLAELASLVEMPQNNEPILQIFSLSLNRIIDNARTSVL